MSRQKGLLERLPLAIASASKALARALYQQMLAVARAVRKSLKWLWKIYCAIELRIAGPLADILLAFVALRFFIVLTLLGIALVFFKLWVVFVIYLAGLVSAIVLYFRQGELDEQQTARHEQIRVRLIEWMPWVFRTTIFIGASYFSWYLVGAPSMTLSQFLAVPKELSKTPEPRPCISDEELTRIYGCPAPHLSGQLDTPVWTHFTAQEIAAEFRQRGCNTSETEIENSVCHAVQQTCWSSNTHKTTAGVSRYCNDVHVVLYDRNGVQEHYRHYRAH